MSECVGVNGFVWNVGIVAADGTLVESFQERNLIPNSGMAFLVRAPFGDISPVSRFFMGVFGNDYVPTGSTTAADIPANMGEIIDYEEAGRPLWDRSFDGSSTMDNLSNKGVITFTQDRKIRGMFLVSDMTKGGNSGLLLSCVRFSTPKDVTAGQSVQLSGGLTYVSTSVI